MGKKWQKIDPAEIKVGDRVRVVDRLNRVEGTAESVVGKRLRVGLFWYTSSYGTWYIRKPKKQKPLTRPDEPPYGVLFRVDRSGIDYCRAATAAYVPVHGELRWRWDQITKPGDTITLLELTEKGDKKDGGV